MVREISFGKLVREHRLSLGLTQAELATRVGCATITDRKIEADALRPSVQIAERLAMALNIPLEERANFVHLARTAGLRTSEPPSIPTPPPMPEEIGEEDLSGRAVRGYSLGERIGEGGFGAVYRAIQPGVEREVAVKIILPKYANHPDFIRCFEAEAQLVARLEHPYIVPLYDYWREPDAAYLIMRLLRGGNLKKYLLDGPLPLENVLHYLGQIGAALHAAHRFGVIHRDLKPANILLDEDENAYLADFGIAKNLGNPNLEDHTQTGTLLGSPAYSSPEQLRSESIKPQTDIYCLGVLIYEMLTGHPPFQGPTPIDYIMQHLNDALPPIRTYNPDLPPAVEITIHKATAKNPADRYPDIPSLLADFRDSLAVDVFDADLATWTTARAESSDIEIENPFKGLRPFGEADAEHFFGRAQFIRKLLGCMSEEKDISRFLAVVGPSGSGKSSVVKAGLIPALRRGGLPGSESWFIVDFMPGSHPYEELEAALLRVAVNPPATLLEQLQANERGLVRAVHRILPADEAVELVLVIDQFEELFTLVEDANLRHQFLDSLVAAILDPRSRLRVIVTMRADFTDRPLQYMDFGELMEARSVFVLPLTPDELEEVVTGPAKQVGLVLEPGLTARIIREIGNQPGTLPLLQYALTELFERREGRKLTLDAYSEIGGVLGALGRRAEEIYTDLDQTSQSAIRQLFLRLVTLGEGVEDTRRRVLRQEIENLGTGDRGLEIGKAYPPPSVLRQVTDRYGKYRLLTFDHDPATRSPTVEVAHEALLREWPRLRGWLDESREDIRIQRQVTRSAEEWEKSERDSGFLIPGGAKLDQFMTWREVAGLALTQVEEDYLQASIIADTEQKEREAHQERTRRNLRRGLVGALIVGLIVAIGLSVYAFGQQRLANEQRQEALRQASIGLAALAEGELGGVDRELSVLLALEAVEYYPYTPQAAGALALSVEEFRAFRILDASKSVADLIMVATWSPDGSRIAAGSSQSPNSVVIWDAATGSELVSVNTHGDLCREGYNKMHDLAWSPSSDRMAAIAQDTDSGEACGVVVFDSTSGETLVTLVGYDSASRSLDWSPDGATILTGHEDGTARLWDAHSGMERATLTGHTGVVLDGVFSPDGSRIATASEDGTVRLWDVETRAEQAALSGHAGSVRSVAWSPDGTRLVTGGSDGLPRVWDLASGETLFVLPGHIDGVVIVTWSADGHRIASQSLDAIVKVWDAATGGFLFQIPNAAPDPATKRGFVEFSPDGNWILAGGSRVLGLRIWDASISVPKLFGHTFGQEWGGWSPDGKLIATSGEDGSARLWDATTGQQLREFDQGSFWGDWSPDGTRLVFAEGIGAYMLNVWDAATGEMLATLSVPGDDFGSHQLLTMNWSPDSLLIAAADFRPGKPQAIYIWNAETTELILTMQTDDTCHLGWPRWSPDGSRIATGCIFVESGINTPARIWDVASGRELMVLESEYGWTYRAVWSPDGARLLTTYENGAAQIWDVETGELTLTFTGHQGEVDGEWSPDGTLIASTDFAEQVVKVWDSLTGEGLFSFSVAGAPLTIDWSPDGTHVIVTGDGFNEPVIKRVWRSTEELIEYAYDCCISRELTPEERDRFGLPERP